MRPSPVVIRFPPKSPGPAEDQHRCSTPFQIHGSGGVAQIIMTLYLHTISQTLHLLIPSPDPSLLTTKKHQSPLKPDHRSIPIPSHGSFRYIPRPTSPEPSIHLSAARPSRPWRSRPQSPAPGGSPAPERCAQPRKGCAAAAAGGSRILLGNGGR